MLSVEAIRHACEGREHISDYRVSDEWPTGEKTFHPHHKWPLKTEQYVKSVNDSQQTPGCVCVCVLEENKSYITGIPPSFISLSYPILGALSNRSS